MTIKKLRDFALTSNVKALGIMLIVILAAYAVPVVMHKTQNPISQRSGLASSLKPGIVGGENTIDPNDGFTSQALGHRAAESWLKGYIPYWNHYEGVGAPLAGEMQSAAFFPLILLLHFSTGFIYFHLILQLIAGFTTYLFFRKLKLRYSLAVLGGVLFSLNGTFVWLTNAAFNPIAFLPMLLLGIEIAIEKSVAKQKGGWILIALALSLSLYSGFPETAFINALFAYGWAAVRLFYIDTTYRKTYIGKIILGSIVGILLTAPLLVAFLDYLPHAITGGHQGNAYANFALPLKTLSALFMPYIYGPIFGYVTSGKPLDLFMFWSNVGGYVTIPLLTIGTFGLYGKRPVGLKAYLFIFSLIVILKNYGFKPVVMLVNLIPGMNKIAFYRYSMPALGFAITILAMFGADALIKAEVTKKKILGQTAIILVGVLLLTLYSRSLFHQLIAHPSHRLWAIFAVSWALSIIIVFGIAFLKSRTLRFLGIVLVLFVDAFGMFIIPYFSLPKLTNIDHAPVAYLQQNLGLNRFYTLHPIAPNYGSYFEIASINTNDLPIPVDWNDYISQKLDSNTNPLVFTGYSRVNANGPTALQEFGKNINTYENLGVKYIVTDPSQVKEDFKQLYGLKEVFSDGIVQIFELPQPKTYFEASQNCQMVSHNRDEVKIQCNDQTKLIRRELYMSGWSATVNEKRQDIQRDDKIFQSINVPAGQSIVKYSYAPPFITIGYFCFGLGLLIMLAVNTKIKRVNFKKIRT